MNIVKTGTTYRLFDKSVETGDKLPAIALEVCFSKFEGFYLKETDMPDLRGEKIYGDSESKVEKVFKSYKADTSKNLGVILSGEKGIGKTLFAKVAASRAIKAGVPVIYVNDYFGGLPGFFRNITQDCLVIFDEFDKNFVSNSQDDRDETAYQDTMLTMFDGVYGGHKLFIITCNDVDKLSDYYVNRPGRFRYHIRFGYPTSEEVRKYLDDKIGGHPDIDRIVKFSTLVPLSYDCLSAIAAEIQLGESFRSAMSMLNIVNISDDSEYAVRFTYDLNGQVTTIVVDWRDEIPLFADDGTENNVKVYSVRCRDFENFGDSYIGKIKFVPAVFRKNAKTNKIGGLEVDNKFFEFEPDDGTGYSNKNDQEVFRKLVGCIKPLSVSLTQRDITPPRISYEHVL